MAIQKKISNHKYAPLKFLKAQRNVSKVADKIKSILVFYFENIENNHFFKYLKIENLPVVTENKNKNKNLQNKFWDNNIY